MPRMNSSMLMKPSPSSSILSRAFHSPYAEERKPSEQPTTTAKWLCTVTAQTDNGGGGGGGEEEECDKASARDAGTGAGGGGSRASSVWSPFTVKSSSSLPGPETAVFMC
jgi:hypothetical protein